MKRQRCRHGFTMVEILIAVSLFVVVGYVSARLVHSTIRLSGQVAAAHDQISGGQRAMALLRRDVWGATGIEAGGRSVHLKRGDHVAVTWRFDEDGALFRDSTDGAQRWGGLIREGAFAAEGAVLVIRGIEADDRPVEVRIASQVLMGGGE